MKTKFTYQKIKQVNTDKGRYYETPSGNFSSVTTILSATSDDDWLTNWKNAVGEEQAEKIVSEAVKIGSRMHELIESHLLEVEPPPPQDKSFYMKTLTKGMAKTIITNGIKNVDEIWGVEAPLYHPIDRYSGTSDLIGVYKGKPSIIDYKSTNSRKSESMVFDYYCQGSAYASAHNHLFDTDIRQIVILMASRDFHFTEYVVEGNEFDKYMSEWKRRVDMFHEQKLSKHLDLTENDTTLIISNMTNNK